MPPVPHQGSKPDLLQLPIAFFWPFVFKLDVSAATVPEKTLIIYEKCLKRGSLLEKLLSNSPNLFKKNSNVVISGELYKSFATKQITIPFLSSEFFQKNVYDRVDF